MKRFWPKVKQFTQKPRHVAIATLAAVLIVGIWAVVAYANKPAFVKGHPTPSPTAQTKQVTATSPSPTVTPTPTSTPIAVTASPSAAPTSTPSSRPITTPKPITPPIYNLSTPFQSVPAGFSTNLTGPISYCIMTPALQTMIYSQAYIQADHSMAQDTPFSAYLEDPNGGTLAMLSGTIPAGQNSLSITHANNFSGVGPAVQFNYTAFLTKFRIHYLTPLNAYSDWYTLPPVCR